MASVSTIHRQTYLASSQPPCDTEDKKHTAKLDVTLEYGYCICMLTGGNWREIMGTIQVPKEQNDFYLITDAYWANTRWFPS